MHLGEAMRAGCEWYDLEIESVSQLSCESLSTCCSVKDGKSASAHFFQRAPKDLKRVAAESIASRPAGRDQDRGAVRVACGSAARALRLRVAERDAIAVPMGDVALPCAILALRERRRFCLCAGRKMPRRLARSRSMK